MRLSKLAIAILCTASLVACENASKAPAEAAIKAAQDAYAPVSTDAKKYLPDQARGVEDAIAAAQTSASKDDWAGALQQATGIPARIGALATAIAAKKTEMAGAWAAMSASLPSMVAAVRAKLDQMSKSKPPAGMTKDSMAQAKNDADAANTEWTQAMTAATSGDMATAMAKATDVQSKVMSLMSMLKISAPTGK